MISDLLAPHTRPYVPTLDAGEGAKRVSDFSSDFVKHG